MKIIQTTIAPTELDVSFNLKANVSLLGVASGIATLDGNGKVPADQLDSLVDSVNGYTGVVVLNKSDLLLGDVDNTSDVDKPVSAATQTALDLKADLSLVGVPSGIASLDGAGKVPATQLPEMASAVTSVNGYTGAVVLAKADVGLADVDNTSDADKPVSTATQVALDLKQDVLVSTLNVKSINGASIVGSGNLNVTGGHTIEDEGTPLAQRTKLNFIGNAVNVTDNSGDDSTEVTINLPETGAGLNLGDWDNSGTFTTGVNFDGNDAKLLIPGITTATRTAATPIEKELLFDTDLNEIYYGDGTTQGGVKLAKEWVITDVKTANYTVKDHEIVPCNSSSGTFDLTAPSSGIFKVVDVVGNLSSEGFGVTSKSVFVYPTVGKTIHGGTSYELDVGALTYTFRLIGTDWRVSNG